VGTVNGGFPKILHDLLPLPKQHEMKTHSQEEDEKM
jgi:hypothetical protein